jgi:hypothetical protein
MSQECKPARRRLTGAAVGCAIERSETRYEKSSLNGLGIRFASRVRLPKWLPIPGSARQSFLATTQAERPNDARKPPSGR